MGRRVITSARQAAAGGESVDTFAARVVKYIPADVVAAWITVSSLFATTSATAGGSAPATAAGAATAQDNTILWVVFGVFVLLTAFWTWRTTQVPGAPVARTQIIVSAVSFVVWAFGIGKPFDSLDIVRQKPFLGGVVLIIWTLVAGMIVPPKSEGGAPGAA